MSECKFLHAKNACITNKNYSKFNINFIPTLFSLKTAYLVSVVKIY